MLPGGVVLSARAMQKIRRREQGHEYAEQLLTSRGARPIRAGEDPARWLAEAIGDIGARRIRRRSRRDDPLRRQHPGQSRRAAVVGGGPVVVHGAWLPKAADLRRDAKDPRAEHRHQLHRRRRRVQAARHRRGGITRATQARYAQEVAARLGWRPEPGKFHLFRVDLTDITFIQWDGKTDDQYVTH
jgi:hypothetical protein